MGKGWRCGWDRRWMRAWMPRLSTPSRASPEATFGSSNAYLRRSIACSPSIALPPSQPTWSMPRARVWSSAHSDASDGASYPDRITPHSVQVTSGSGLLTTRRLTKLTQDCLEPIGELHVADRAQGIREDIELGRGDNQVDLVSIDIESRLGEVASQTGAAGLCTSLCRTFTG